MRQRTAILSVLLLLGMSSAASAAPFTFSEAVSGDLCCIPPLPTVFLLDVGVNTVAGTTHFASDAADADDFAFQVPVGTRLTAISFGFVTTSNVPVTGGEIGYQLDTGNAFATAPYLAAWG